MSTLAIKGHPTRGSEVIALLEMLGGKNIHKVTGDISYVYYAISPNNDIYIMGDRFSKSIFIHFTLEEFESKYPYKVGDKVLYKTYGLYLKIKSMLWNEEKEQVFYRLDSNMLFVASVDELQPYKEQETMKKEILPYFLTVYDSEENKHEIVADKDYEIIEENGKYYAVKKRPKYPQTYEECCKVLGITTQIALIYADSNKTEVDYLYKQNSLLNNFLKIIICRDAYWKIAGDWKPNDNTPEDYYYIVNKNGKLYKDNYFSINHILKFPTEEMRDAFYENFKYLIGQCKEFL